MAVSFQLLRSSTASKRPTAANLAAGELGLNFNDDTSGLFYENATGNVMKVGPCEVSASAPNASPAAGGSSGNSKGEFWYDTGNSALKVWDGDSWEIANSGSTAGISTSANATAITIGSNEQCTFSQSVTLQGDDLTSEAALDVKVLDNSGLALRIMEDTTEYMRVVTTDGSESITIKKALHCDGVFEVDNGVTLADQTNIQMADNSGFAFRIREGTSEYMRFTTTDGGEKIVTKKTLEVDGALDIDGAVDCSGQVTFTGAQTITVPDNLGFGLRVSSADGAEFVRFTTTDGSELVDFSKTVKLDGGMTLGGGISVPASQDITLVDGNSNAIDFVIDGGNRMMRFNTSTETVLMEQNIDVGGTANFDEVDIDSTVDIAGGPVTFSANSKINIPDNSGSAFKIQQGDSEPIISIATTDAVPTVTFDYRVIFDEDILFTGAHDILMTDNTAAALTIGEATNAYMTFDTSNGSELITSNKNLTLAGNLTFDSVALTAIQTSAETFADNDTSLMTSAAIDDRINNAAGVTQDSGTTTLTFNGFSSNPDPKLTVTAYWVKTGKQVTLTFSTTQNFGSYGGSATVTGLAHTADSNTEFFGVAHHDGSLSTSVNDGIVARIRGAAGTTIDFLGQETDLQLAWSGTNASKELGVTITYFTA